MPAAPRHAQHLPRYLQGVGAQFFDDLYHPVAFFPPHAAERTGRRDVPWPLAEVRRSTIIRSGGTCGRRNASSLNSGRRFSTPIRGRSSFAIAGRCLATPSMALQTSPNAAYCLRFPASELSRTKAALNKLCISGSESRTSASPILWMTGPIKSMPGAANRSANFSSSPNRRLAARVRSLLRVRQFV